MCWERRGGRVHVQNALCVSIPNVSVCTGTTRTCVSICARGAGTHGDVLNRDTGVFTTPHHNHDHDHSHTQEGHGHSCRLPALVFNHFHIQSRRGHLQESHGYSCRLSALVSNFSPLLTFRALHGNHIVSTPFQTIVEEDKHKKHKKIVTHVSVHTLTFHETHYPPAPPGNPWTIH